MVTDLEPGLAAYDFVQASDLELGFDSELATDSELVAVSEQTFDLEKASVPDSSVLKPADFLLLGLDRQALWVDEVDY